MQIREHVNSGKPALILAGAGTAIDFAELEERANRLAHYWRAAGLREGDTVAAIMENNEHVHVVMWAARRSGLYYAMINTQLTAAEAAYIVDNSGAKAVIGSRAMRTVCEGLGEYLPDGLPGLLLIADDDLDRWERYPECVAGQPATPIRDETEGDYASSEAVGASFIRAEDWLAHPGSVGRPLVGVPHILGENGQELPPGQPGEIYYEGGHSFEYLKDEAKTSAARDRTGGRR
jgi:acyl-CoA synthetase (AMP-forming)/AMP-acid ligase II